MIRHRCHQLRRICTEVTPDTPEIDFAHHAKGISRLNHGSFGACPRSVLQIQNKFRNLWLEQPDALYFSGELDRRVRIAAEVAGSCLVPSTVRIDNDHVCLTENSTVAACSVSQRWSKNMQPGDVIVHFDLIYKACTHVLEEYCVQRSGAERFVLELPFLVTEPQEILNAIRTQLLELYNNHGKKPRFAFLDHVSSQPAILLPIKEIIEIIREFGTDDIEIAVDGAHGIGSVPNLNVLDMGCDFYWSNIHKWGFSPASSAVLFSRLLPEMQHPIVSWNWGQGMAEESIFPGTRDFSAFMAVPAAVDYLNKWRDPNDRNSQKFCHDKVVQVDFKNLQ